MNKTKPPTKTVGFSSFSRLNIMEVARHWRTTETRYTLKGAIFLDADGQVVGYSIDPTRPFPTHIVLPQKPEDIASQIYQSPSTPPRSGEKKR